MNESDPRVSLIDPCPNCGELFGEQEGPRNDEVLPNRIEAEADALRIDGRLIFEVRFACPECGQEFLVEDLADGQMYAK